MTPLCYPITRPVRTTSVGFEPISLQQARDQCFLGELGYHDQRLTGYIKDAREQLEKDASVAIATGTYVYRFSQFPYGEYLELQDLTPITSITSIVYIASDGTSTTWSSAEYSLDTYAVAPIVRLGYGYLWPANRGDVNGITVTVVAGYSAITAVPEQICEAVKLWVSHLWWLGPGQDPRQAEACEAAYMAKVSRIRREVYA